MPAAVFPLESRVHLIVLLGGDAGLRCGEIMALEWRNVDLEKRQICVQRSEWKGHVTVPKGGRLRYVPMTRRLAAALRDHRHLRSARQRYMHLSPAAIEGAIRLLDQSQTGLGRGDILETRIGESAISNT